MLSIKEVVDQVNSYFLSKDPEFLAQAIAMLETEKSDPSLQATIITLGSTSMDDVDRAIRDKGCLVLATDAGGEDINSDGPVSECKIIRVMCENQPPDSCMLFFVAHLDDTKIVLVPVS